MWIEEKSFRRSGGRVCGWRGYPGAVIWPIIASSRTQDCFDGEYSLVLAHESASNTYGYWVLTLPDLTFPGLTEITKRCRPSIEYRPDMDLMVCERCADVAGQLGLRVG